MSRVLRSFRRAVLAVACVFAAVLWLRSYSIADWFWYRTETSQVGIASCRGAITFALSSSSARVTEESGLTHNVMDASDRLIDPVPPDMRLVAGFGAMTERPQFDALAPVTWRFLVVPWWSIAVLAAGALLASKVKAHARSLTHRTYASMSNFLSSPLAFMKRTSPKIGRAGPQGRSCSPNSQATLA
jgi:hypothetical protein